MKKRQFFVIASVFLCWFVFVNAVSAQTKLSTKKAVAVKPGLPDLTIDSIKLNNQCHVVIHIKNRGEGTIPAAQYLKAKLRVYYDKSFVDYPMPGGSKKKVSNGSDKLLIHPGGVLVFNTKKKINVPTRIRAQIDRTRKVQEANEKNNRSAAVMLKPNCKKIEPSRQASQPKTTPSPSPTATSQTLKKPVKLSKSAGSSMAIVPSLNKAGDLIRWVEIEGKNFPSNSRDYEIRIERLDTSGKTLETYGAIVEHWDVETIVVGMPHRLLNPPNPAEAGRYLTERVGSRFKIAMYKRSEARRFSNKIYITVGSADKDRDGHKSDRFGGDDCDDKDPNRYPGNAEIGDTEGHDEDCNPETIGKDHDGDGYVSDRFFNVAGGGIENRGRDCNDENAGVSPDAIEVCNNQDDDCDGQIDEYVKLHAYYDRDGDLFGDPNVRVDICFFELRAGVVANNTDCDDTNPTINPGQANCR